MQELVATSWQEALDHLYAGSWQAPLQRYRSTVAYRGVSRRERDLKTGLARVAEHPAAVEQHLLRNFRKYAEDPPEARFDSIWHWLALAQHHGLPTRLLDRTYAPLVSGSRRTVPLASALLRALQLTIRARDVSKISWLRA